jgi:hypothetical protein
VTWFRWKDRDINNVGDLVDALDSLTGPTDGQAFMAAYLAVEQHAAANVGYCAYYLPLEKAQQVTRWTNTAHPIITGRL